VFIGVHSWFKSSRHPLRPEILCVLCGYLSLSSALQPEVLDLWVAAIPRWKFRGSSSGAIPSSPGEISMLIFVGVVLS
jgi:hypothetical protein